MKEKNPTLEISNSDALNARSYRLSACDNRTLSMVGSDGGLLDETVGVNTLLYFQVTDMRFRYQPGMASRMT